MDTVRNSKNQKRILKICLPQHVQIPLHVTHCDDVEYIR